MGCKIMIRNCFLNYTDSNLLSIDLAVRRVLALHTYIKNGAEITDDLEISYGIKLSLRQWAIEKNGIGRRSKSKWSLVSDNLILDSVMRDQHIVLLQSRDVESEQLRICVDSPKPNCESPRFHSAGLFRELDSLLKLSAKAQTQVRWLRIPGTNCEGVIFSENNGGLQFFPISMDIHLSSEFVFGKAYKPAYLFDFVKDSNLDGRRPG